MARRKKFFKPILGKDKVRFRIPVKKRKTITKSDLKKLNKARKGNVENPRPLSIKKFEARSKGVKVVSG